MNEAHKGKVHALETYAQVGVQSEAESASPHRLIQLLQEGALSRIALARSYIQQGATDRKGECIGRAISIIGGLRDSLDVKTGGSLAQNLDGLYEYMTYRLLEANLKNDVEILTEVHGLLSEIKTAWDAIGQTRSPHEPARIGESLHRRVG